MINHMSYWRLMFWKGDKTLEKWHLMPNLSICFCHFLYSSTLKDTLLAFGRWICSASDSFLWTFYLSGWMQVNPPLIQTSLAFILFSTRGYPLSNWKRGGCISLSKSCVGIHSVSAWQPPPQKGGRVCVIHRIGAMFIPIWYKQCISVEGFKAKLAPLFRRFYLAAAATL